MGCRWWFRRFRRSPPAWWGIGRIGCIIGGGIRRGLIGRGFRRFIGDAILQTVQGIVIPAAAASSSAAPSGRSSGQYSRPIYSTMPLLMAVSSGVSPLTEISSSRAFHSSAGGTGIGQDDRIGIVAQLLPQGGEILLQLHIEVVHLLQRQAVALGDGFDGLAGAGG